MQMKNSPSNLLLLPGLAIGLLLAGFSLAQTHTDRESVISVRSLQIVDSSGRPRIIMGTDQQGVASVTFTAQAGVPSSVIKQFPSGSMRIEFAGKVSGTPNVVLTSDAVGVGPALMMHGVGKGQVIMLGFNGQEGEKPGEPAKVWGLFLPGQAPFSNVAALGVQEEGGGKWSSFLIPQSR